MMAIGRGVSIFSFHFFSSFLNMSLWLHSDKGVPASGRKTWQSKALSHGQKSNVSKKSLFYRKPIIQCFPSFYCDKKCIAKKLTLKKVLVIFILCICVIACMHHVHVVPMESRRGQWIPYSWNYKWLRTPLCRWWEPKLGPLQEQPVVLLTSEPSFNSQIWHSVI